MTIRFIKIADDGRDLIQDFDDPVTFVRTMRAYGYRSAGADVRDGDTRGLPTFQGLHGPTQVGDAAVYDASWLRR